LNIKFVKLKFILLHVFTLGVIMKLNLFFTLIFMATISAAETLSLRVGQTMRISNDLTVACGITGASIANSSCRIEDRSPGFWNGDCPNTYPYLITSNGNVVDPSCYPTRQRAEERIIELMRQGLCLSQL
jgi:hypothetical protein